MKYQKSENKMDNINTVSAADNSAADKLFHILKQFLENKRIKVDDISDDLPGLLHLCEIHGLQPILYYMLGSDTEHLRECYPELEKRMRDQYIALAYLSIQQDAAAQEMAERFRQAGIPLAFFKGTLLRSFYPEPQLRTMGDIDCVISRDDRSQAHDLMAAMGYECESDKGDVWVYNRGRVSVEMHTRIAGNLSQNGFDYRAFFSDAIEHTEQNGNYIFLKREYHFCFLIYHIAKHLYSTGAGIRMFLDIAMFLRHYGDEFDWQQAEELLQKTRLSKMVGAVFQLCNRWFGTDITWKDRVREEVLDQLERYIIDGGTFGFATHDVGDIYLRRGYEKSEKGGKRRFHFRLLWNYLFPSAENMLQIMPSVEKHRWLLPAAWIKRWWLGAFRRRSHSIHTMKSMFKDDDGRGQKEYQMLKELGL